MRMIILLLVIAATVWLLSSNQEWGNHFDMLKEWFGFSNINNTQTTVKQPVGITSIQHTAASPLQDDKITLIKASVDKNEALPGIMTPGKDDELMKLMNIQGGATDFPKEYADALTRGANQRIGKLPPVPIAGQDLLRPIIDRDQATSDQAYEMATGLGISRTEPGLSWAKEMIQQKY